MEYSPRNAIPTVSKVDAGTIELVESFGPKVVSSADLLQSYTSVWTEVQLRSHLEAAEVLENSVDKAWRFIAEHIKQNKPLSEREVQSFLLKEFDKQECRCDDPPICAVNAHAADPHYSPDKEKETFIKSGDFVLIDLWCRKKYPQAVYADITRVGVVDNMPTQEQQHIFSLVKQAREAAMTLLKKRIELKEPIMGCEVDQACRDVITQAGFGPYFTHRTGHNIGERDHGDGANIDNFETKDTRHLLPGTCFSIEPGIYLPGKFGVRLENNVFLERDGRGLRVTGGTQENIVCLL
jgi:Xaa-Pro aminopeptidase